MSALKHKHYDTIIKPVITEKATVLSEQNKVVFQVPLTATKADVKEAVEKLFNVKVGAVNTIRHKGKTKQFRGIPGKRSDTKKAVVTLLAGYSIDVTTGLS
ncbi:MAG: 50S ribosomal protein L23 [Hyphomonadaceae bacterium]